MIRAAVHGAEGRMGLLVAALLEEAPDVELVGLITEPGRAREPGDFHPRLPLLGQDHFSEVIPAGTVLVDFSLAGALAGLLRGGAALQAPLVVGTTGYSADQLAALKDYAREQPVVHAANFSIGISALRMLLQLMARVLPEGFDAEEVEVHHRTKRDRPSGTALMLAEAYGQVRGGGVPPIHAQRLGGVVGEHTWMFSDQEETLVLTHRAHSRGAFLRGILPALRFVATAGAGLFDLQDVLLGSGSGQRA